MMQPLNFDSSTTFDLCMHQAAPSRQSVQEELLKGWCPEEIDNLDPTVKKACSRRQHENHITSSGWAAVIEERHQFRESTGLTWQRTAAGSVF